MQPLLNVSKAWHTIPAGSLKSKKHETCKIKLPLGETKKVKQLYSEIPSIKHKFENIITGMQLDYKSQNEKLKHFYSILGAVKVNTENSKN